jgi:hypothetical protein
MAGTGITHIGRTDFRGDHPTFGIKLEDRLSGAGTGGANRSGASGRRSRPNGSAKKQPRAQLALGARVLDTRGICWTGGLGGKPKVQRASKLGCSRQRGWAPPHRSVTLFHTHV